jgi:DNA polymerase III epsilon subunit-like protein
MNILVWDTETTGLTLHPSADLAAQPRIIEFACMTIDSARGAVVSEHSVLINPLQRITEEITKITGITNEMIADAPNFVQALPLIAAQFTRAREGAMLAHNLEFDETMLRNELRRALITGFDWPKHGICTVQLYTEEWGRNPKLTELYERKMGHKLAQTHRALDDVRALTEIVIQERLWELYPD